VSDAATLAAAINNSANYDVEARAVAAQYGSREYESEIIAKLCNIAQLRDHFRSILVR
jgi:hypothetical protein